MIKKLYSLLVFGLLSLCSFGQLDLTINPSLGSPSDGCQLGVETITATLVNVGVDPFSGTLEMGYTLNAGAPVTVPVPIGIMMPSGTFIYSFPVDDDFSACQAHDLRIWVYAAADVNNLNDTLDYVVESDCPPTLGVLSGADTVCYGMNSGNINLTGYSGYPLEWLISNDNGGNWTSVPVPGNDDTLAYNNVTNETLFKVVVGSIFGLCPSDTTWVYTLAIDGPSDAGILPADFEICDNGNTGVLVTTAYNGTILDWIESSDNGATWNSTGVANDTLPYLNLTDTMQYQVIVSTNFCPADTAGPIILTLIPGSVGGSVIGESVVCNQLNDSSLAVVGFTGDTFAWWYSLDSGATWLLTIDADSIYEYDNLNAGTIYFAAEVTLGACPSSWSTVHIMDVLPLFLDAGPDTTITEGDAVQLYATGGLDYFWYPDDFMDDPTSQYPTVNPDVNTTYYVQITDINGCVDTSIALITVAPDISALVIPNLFTPNNDGFNDSWEILNIAGFVDNEISIFNIYGQLINEYAPYNNEWDGTYNGSTLPDGTYYYVLRLNDPLYPDPIQGSVTITGNE
jgi:gliding motility-associated-like protein